MRSFVRAHLHEEARDQRLADVDVVVLAVEVRAGALEGEPVHDAGQLLPHVVGRLEGPALDEVVVAPLHVLIVCQRQEGGVALKRQARPTTDMTNKIHLLTSVKNRH